MATLRLGDNERCMITQAFDRVLSRAQNNQAFPLEEDEVEEFGLTLLSDKARSAYEYLSDFEPKLVRSSEYNPDFKIRSPTYKYEISMRHVKMPHDGLLVPESHQWHTEIMEWATQYCDVQSRISEANQYVQEITYACSSVGQIKRIMQDEILRFVPNYMQQTFCEAERKSRIPRGFTIEEKRLEELADVLALGSLSPEDESGVPTSVNRSPI